MNDKDPDYYTRYDDTLILLAVLAGMHPQQLELRARDLRRALNKPQAKSSHERGKKGRKET